LQSDPLSQPARFWRNRGFARARHNLVLPVVARTRIGMPSVKRNDRLIRPPLKRTIRASARVASALSRRRRRRSGQRRSTPVGYLPRRDGYAVLASNPGSDRNPAWWLNLQADPQAEVMVERKVVPVVAEVAAPERNDRLWEVFGRMNPGYHEYRRLTDRPIPVVLLRHTD
jgi:deazaflavin-dependent oxidoreductase (nitroreductase family)